MTPTCPQCLSDDPNQVGVKNGVACTAPFHCPSPEAHGNPFRYCPNCSWAEPSTPAPSTMAFSTPCPVTDCDTTISGVVRLAFEVGTSTATHVHFNVRPTFPVEWSDEAQQHLTAHVPRHLTQVLPETSSDERMHVLDETCWCEPTIDGDKLVHA